MRKVIILLTILFLATILRLYRFTSNPPGIYWDEAAIGYNAYSILQTGKDEWGVARPLLFRSFGDYKLPLYIYIAALSEKIFGVNEVGVRVPSVLAGILSVAIIYLLTKKLFGIEKIALLTALFLAISPWHLQFSRGGFEANLSLFFTLTGLLFFLNWRLFLATIFFAASMYTYHSARIFTPLFGLALLIVYRKQLLTDWRKSLTVAVFTILILSPLLPVYFSKEGNARLDTESIMHQKGGLVANLTENYLAMFNSDFLFFRGDQAGRHSVKKIGELYLWQLPLVIVGVFFLFKKKDKVSMVVFGWLMLAAIPPAVTSISPHAIRGLLEAPIWQVISGLGLVAIMAKFSEPGWKIIAAGGCSLVIFYSSLVYLHLYHVHYPAAYSLDWQYGIKNALEISEKLSSRYSAIYTYQELPYIHLLFYTKFDPEVFQMSGHDTKNIGKYHWLGEAKFPDKRNPDDKLLIISPEFLVSKDNPAVIREVKLLNGDPIYRIYDL
jgi:4-amino-4-deoxy-L-arabinose transferase-like glycosyltransferase